MDTLQKNTDENDGNESDDSQKTVDYEDNFETLKKIKEEQRCK
jgi:dihydroneopterin aldolase